MSNVAKDREAPIDEAFRYRLSAGDLDGVELTFAAVGALLERVELSHARALRRRREQLLGSVIDHLEASGCWCDPLSEWAIIANATDRVPGAFQVAPRRPRVEDLRALERERDRLQGSAGMGVIAASLVHEVKHIGRGPC